MSDHITTPHPWGRAALAALLSAALLAGCGGSGSDAGGSSSSASSSSSQSSSSSSQSSSDESISMLSTDGTDWVKADGSPIALRGTNLGNWLLQEFWMMGQSTDAVNDQCTLESVLDNRFGQAERERLMEMFRDNWITERDWNQMDEFGLNVVRVPFIWNLIEDENNHYSLRDDAWEYLDYAIEQAEARNMYVILDLHGAAGAQGWEHHSGCAENNWYWDGGNGQPASYYQDRTIWLWQQIAERYKDRESIAGYGLLNEPWGTSPETLAQVMTTLYNQVREVDPDHIIILPGHSAGIDAYGHPDDHDMTNVAFEMHFYPGIFGWGEIGYDVHRDWLTCGPDGTGGVCEWQARLEDLDTPFLIGEFQPWTGLGLELGAKTARATYDTYVSYGWASTSWAYKVLSNTGGQGAGTWGMVTNQSSLGLLTKADTWACAGWDSDFDIACGTATPNFTVPGEGEQQYYLAIKAGACCAGSLDVSLDSVSLIDEATESELIVNGSFDDSSSWSNWTVGEPVTSEFNHSDSNHLPAGSDGGLLRLSSDGESNGGIYQAITLQGGQTYQFGGVFKDNASESAWAEIYLVQQQPEDGVDITGASLPQLDFENAPIEDIEALFQAFGSLEYDVHEPLKQWLTAEQSPDLFDLPATPTGLQVDIDDAGNHLSWSAGSGDVSGYNVYRSTILGDPGEAIATVTETAYTDDSATDQTYFYTVTALSGEAESYPADQVATEIIAFPFPGRLQAENFVAMSGVQLENTTDAGGGNNVGYFEPGDWVEYLVDIETAGTYTVQYRLASNVGSNGFTVLLDGSEVDSVTVDDTGGWQSWVTVTHTFDLPAGEHTLRLLAVGAEWNINWIDFSAP